MYTVTLQAGQAASCNLTWPGNPCLIKMTPKDKGCMEHILGNTVLGVPIACSPADSTPPWGEAGFTGTPDEPAPEWLWEVFLVTSASTANVQNVFSKYFFLCSRDFCSPQIPRVGDEEAELGLWGPSAVPCRLLLYVTCSWAARWEQFILRLWGDDVMWDADLILQRATPYREKHGPKSHTAEPPILKKSLGSRGDWGRDHWWLSTSCNQPPLEK